MIWSDRDERLLKDILDARDMKDIIRFCSSATPLRGKAGRAMSALKIQSAILMKAKRVVRDWIPAFRCGVSRMLTGNDEAVSGEHREKKHISFPRNAGISGKEFVPSVT